MHLTEKTNPARPGSPAEQERAEIRKMYKPSAREIFQITVDLARITMRGDE